MSTITWGPQPVLTLPSRRRATAPAAPAASAAPDATAPAAHLRLTRRGRLVVSLLAALVGTGVVLSAQSAGADAPPRALPLVTHVVAPGETLWEIAGGVAEPGVDRRDVVGELVELNGLGSASLQAGQEILLPRD